MPPSEENQITPPPGENPWGKAFQEGDLPRRNEISIGVISRKVDEFVARRQIWGSKDVVQAIRQDMEYEEPVLRAPIEIAKGSQPIMALNPSQAFSVRSFFEIPHSSSSPLYALIENAGEERRKIEVEVKTAFIKPKTIDHLVISEEAAKQLGISPEAERKGIRVLEMYHKVEDIDLDNL